MGTSTVPSGGAYRLRITGELDLLTTPGMVDSALAPRNGGDVLIDLTGVTFIDAVGLGGLITVRAGLARTGRRLFVVGASARVTRTFALACAEALLGRSPQPPDAHILTQLPAVIVEAVRAAPRNVRLRVARPDLAGTR